MAGCQINPIDVNFHLQKSLKMFDKNSAHKIWSKNDKEIKVSPLMPIRVNPCMFWELLSRMVFYKQHYPPLNKFKLRFCAKLHCFFKFLRLNARKDNI